MAELAVLGIFLGLWRALAASAGMRRDHTETMWSWSLVGVSVLLALTATFPSSLTDPTAPPCSRPTSCPARPQAQDIPRMRGPVVGDPGLPMPVQLTG
ncbi:hypothetical protein [Pseudonocardia acaciae]|uniref:hypothetical protein n=1 Tax=Pseudonocardia acaciae TaxID=551276 RepID=UPI00048ABCC0|nr:hypothetical protein [Pseudonocardia acaciae]